MVPVDIDIRLLRNFIAAAEELHFTRAAARLYVAQQALSRDIARLEAQLGVALFARTTRQVALTPEGERLLPRARELVDQHDQLIQDFHGQPRDLIVDVVGEQRTPTLVLDAARTRVPGLELVARFGGGLGAVVPAVLAGRLDVAFGRTKVWAAGSPTSSPTTWSASSRWACSYRTTTRSPRRLPFGWLTSGVWQWTPAGATTPPQSGWTPLSNCCTNTASRHRQPIITPSEPRRLATTCAHKACRS